MFKETATFNQPVMSTANPADPDDASDDTWSSPNWYYYCDGYFYDYYSDFQVKWCNEYNSIREMFGSTGLLVATCIVCPVGVVTNILILIVAFRKKIRETPSMNYLILLGFADLTSMATDLISDTLEYLSATPNDFACIFFYVLMNWGQLVSVYTIIAISADRLYMVDDPLKASQNATRKKVVIIMVAYSLVLFAPQIHYIWLIHNDQGECWYRDDTPLYLYIFQPILRSLAPLITLVVLNTLIVRALRKAKTKREEMTGVIKDDPVTTQVTRMLIATTIWYFITVLLYVSYYPLYLSDRGDNLDPTIEALQWMKTKFLFVTIADTMLRLNHAGNLFCYCLTGSNFRNEFKKVFRCGSEMSGAPQGRVAGRQV